MLLALKLFLAPVLIGLVSIAGRRWGPAVGGWLVSLPLTSAPVILFLAIEQGTAFASRAAQDTLLGIISVASFCLVYCWFSFRFGWPVSMLAGWGAFFALTFIEESIILPLLFSFVVVLAFLAVVLIVMPESQSKDITINPPPWDTPLRMLVATAFVLGLTGAASILGPQLSGLLAPFPMFTTILAVFTHHFQGPDFTRRLLRGVVAGSFTFVVFFLFISLLVNRWGIAIAFSLAILAAIVIHGTSLYLMSRFSGVRAKWRNT
jgi:hypothetical protein